MSFNLHRQVSLVESGPNPEANSGDMEEESRSPAIGSAARQPDHVSELGALVMSSTRAGPAVLHGVLLALTWADSTSSLKACSLALPALRAALQAGRLSAAEAGAALAAALHALRTHGQHDANQVALLALGVQVCCTVTSSCSTNIKISSASNSKLNFTPSIC